MTVKELIERLKKFNGDLTVGIWIEDDCEHVKDIYLNGDVVVMDSITGEYDGHN